MSVYIVNLTYRCNLQCKYCNRLLDVRQYDPETHDITHEHLDQFEKGLADKPVAKIKVSGGEPTLHPQYQELVGRLVDFAKKKGAFVAVSSNATTDVPDPPGASMRKVRPDKKGVIHEPHLISPWDFGIKSLVCDRDKPCTVAKRCGRCFEARGWTFCSTAGAMAELLKLDIWRDEPRYDLEMAVCRHCVWSMPADVRTALTAGVHFGLFEYPSHTWAEALGVRARRRANYRKGLQAMRYFHEYRTRNKRRLRRRRRKRAV